MYNSGEYEMISYFEQNNYNVKSISYKEFITLSNSIENKYTSCILL